MPVNDGSGSQIGFSDLQTAFGGMHPISLSEYYRGGEVGTTRTVVAANSGVTGAVTRTNAGGTSLGSLRVSSFTGNGVVNTADLSYVYARSEGMGNHTVVLYPGPNGSGHPTQIFSYSQDDNPGFTIAYRGAAYQSGDGSPTVRANATQYGGNRSLGFSGFRTPAQIGRRTVTTNPTTYDVTYTNNTGSTITSISTPQGTISSLAAGATHTFSGASSNAVTPVTHAAVTATDANSNIPGSGQVSMNQFNSITNYTPG